MSAKLMENTSKGLVKAELRAQGFIIAGVHTNKYNDQEWAQTGHNLDFVAETPLW